MHGEKPKSENTSLEKWDMSDTEFAGETNINSKTGKERSFKQFDLYPRQKGESNEEYGQRLKRMNELTAEWQASEQAKAEEASQDVVKDDATSDYFDSVHGQKELDAQERYDRLDAKLENAVAEGRLSRERANMLLEQELERFDQQVTGFRQDYEDSKQVGTPEDDAKVEEWRAKQDKLFESLTDDQKQRYEDRVVSEESFKIPVSEAPEDDVTSIEEQTPEDDQSSTEELTVPEDLQPEIREDLLDKLSDIDRWQKNDRHGKHPAEYYDGMRKYVIAEAEKEQQSYLEKLAVLEQEKLDALEQEQNADAEVQSADTKEDEPTADIAVEEEPPVTNEVQTVANKELQKAPVFRIKRPPKRHVYRTPGTSGIAQLMEYFRNKKNNQNTVPAQQAPEVVDEATNGTQEGASNNEPEAQTSAEAEALRRIHNGELDDQMDALIAEGDNDGNDMEVQQDTVETDEDREKLIEESLAKLAESAKAESEYLSALITTEIPGIEAPLDDIRSLVSLNRTYSEAEFGQRFDQAYGALSDSDKARVEQFLQNHPEWGGSLRGYLAARREAEPSVA